MKIKNNPLGFVIMLVLVLSVWVIGSLSNKSEVKTIDFTPSDRTSTASPFRPTEPNTGTEGDSLDLNGTTILAGRIWAGDGILGDRTCAPVTYINRSGENIQLAQYDWKLTTPAGLVLDATIGGNAKMLPWGALAPGGTADGHVCFATKHENRGLWKLEYKPSIWTNGSLTWTNQ